MEIKFVTIAVSINLLFSISVYGQLKNYSTTSTINRLKTYNSEYTIEKAYLHFDKPYYAAGDTIYFKAYVTLGEKHELSTLSGVLHVDFINTLNKIDQSIKLQIINGITWGDFALPDSLPAGNYRIRAYTQWMRNEGDEAYFDQTIPVGSALNNRIPESGVYSKTSTPPDIQFFPEGGSLVTEISSKVAFKAVNANGLGIAAKGIITDNAGQEIIRFETAHLGMGSFELKPEPGKTYNAKVIYENGLQQLVKLPFANKQGIVLQVNNDTVGKAAVKIVCNKGYLAENEGKEIGIIIYNGGLVNALTIKLDSTEMNLTILKRHLHSGITQITLFSDQGEPLCERLIFIQNPDLLKLSLRTDKTIYKTREKVQLKLNALTRADSATTGHFSVSVTNDSKGQVNDNTESTILTNLLLTSDLKGYIEEPNYYFINPSAETQSHLDLVMLTHGYRSFEWKKLVNNEHPPVAYQPEKGLEIAGIAKNAFGKPLVNGVVSLIPQNGGSFITQNTDEKGNFRFSNLFFTDSIKFILQAVNAKGKNTTQLVYKKEISGPPTLTDTFFISGNLNQPAKSYINNNREQRDEAVNNGTATGVMLKEVKIKQSKKKIIEDDYRSSSLSGPGHADQVLHKQELDKIGGSLVTKLNGRLRGVTFPGDKPVLTGYGYQMPILVVVDGVYLSSLNGLNPNDIETVEVLKFNNAAIYGMQGGHGVIVITTRQGGSDPNDIRSVGILPITVSGFYKAREFYSPKYEHADNSFKRKDLRSTIYWKPEIVTAKDGNASIEYYNADGTGTYKVVIEGIDDKGNLGRLVYRYKVE